MSIFRSRESLKIRNPLLSFFVSLLLASLVAACAPKGRVVIIDDAVIDGADYMKVIYPVWYSVSIYDGQEKYEKDIARFSAEQRFVFACVWYLSEVDNGGHQQFYWNSTGVVWKDAVRGFEAMGLKEFAEVIAESVRRMGGSPSLDRAERQRQLEQVAPEFDDLDDRIYALESDVDIDKKLMEFIRSNRLKFYFSGRVSMPVSIVD